jgi:hypothetical protein
MFRSSRNELRLVEASSKRWQYFSIRVTHSSQLGGPLDGGEAAVHHRPQLPTDSRLISVREQYGRQRYC